MLYALEKAEVYPTRQVNTGATVTYANVAGDVARAKADNQFSVNYKKYQDERSMDYALRDRLYKMLGPYHRDVRKEARGLGTLTFLQVAALSLHSRVRTVHAKRKRCQS